MARCLAVLALAGALGLNACGGSSKDHTQPGPPTGGPPWATLSIRRVDFGSASANDEVPVVQGKPDELVHLWTSGQSDSSERPPLLVARPARSLAVVDLLQEDRPAHRQEEEVR